MHATFLWHTLEQVGRAFMTGSLVEILEARLADHVWVFLRALDYGIAAGIVAFGFCLVARHFRNPVEGPRTGSFTRGVEYRWTR